MKTLRDLKGVKPIRAKDTTQQQKDRRVLYQTRRWERASKAFLAENPLCAECQRNGKVVPSHSTDHIVPHRGDYGKFWDYANWQALCQRCHARKSREEGNVGRLVVPRIEQSTCHAVYVVSGLPASGKSHYVRQRASSTDYVWDLDVEAEQMGLASSYAGRTGHDISDLLRARNAFLFNTAERVAQHEQGSTWIIITRKDVAEEIARGMRAQHVHLHVSEAERQSRLATRAAARAIVAVRANTAGDMRSCDLGRVGNV